MGVLSKTISVEKIVSGGQTGVDRAALDAAMMLGFPIGGWCPKGRRAEDGKISARYKLQETEAIDYRVRTGWNVRDSDATLILFTGKLSGGTKITLKFTKEQNKPCFTCNLDDENGLPNVVNWIFETRPKVLNIAGPRESGRPGIHEQAKQFIIKIFH